MKESTELIVPEKINALEIYTNGQVDPILEEITRKAKSFTPKLDTDKGRKEIASMARKVASSKVYLDNLGKELVASWKEQSKAVDSSRKHIRDYLDALRDEVRQPLTEYEKEQERLAEEARIKAEIEAAHTAAIEENILFDRQCEIERKEAEIARIEAERKAKEEAERLEKERQEREARITREAEERARIEAETKAERERQEYIRREVEAKAEKARMEREAKEAAERSEREKKEAAEKAEREKQAAIEAEKARAKAEADRIEAERKQREWEEQERKECERLEAERKASDLEHRKQINLEALADFEQGGIDSEIAKSVIRLIAMKKISHISIQY